LAREVSGIKTSLIIQAKKAALGASRKLQGKCAAIRRIVPWSKIEKSLLNSAATDSVSSLIPSKNFCERYDGFRPPRLSQINFLRGAIKLIRITGSDG
jgi:hypothetical protein